MIESSLERIVPDELNLQLAFDSKTLKLHRERYQFALEHLAPGRILDIACGVGYGSFQMMSDNRLTESNCTAVDVSRPAISYAVERYAHPRIDFVCKDFAAFSPAGLFDSIVSLETIEHISDLDLFMTKLNGFLRPGGILIISAPVTPSTDGNPHHCHDFTPGSFRKLLGRFGFAESSCLLQVQPYSLNQWNPEQNKRPAREKKALLRFYANHPKVFWARIYSLLKDGLNNKYLTLAMKKQ